jgi:biopolymer transport protein ExbB
MPAMPELPGFLAQLLEKGGHEVTGVLVLSAWMWWLIGERFWFLQWRLPTLCERMALAWQAERPARAEVRRRLRMARGSLLDGAIRAHFGTIRALTMVLPLLGLLGTVTGMITTFDAMTVEGDLSPRALSRGIDSALVSTIAGLVTALSGLYAGRLLEARAARERERIAALFH